MTMKPELTAEEAVVHVKVWFDFSISTVLSVTIYFEVNIDI